MSPTEERIVELCRKITAREKVIERYQRLNRKAEAKIEELESTPATITIPRSVALCVLNNLNYSPNHWAYLGTDNAAVFRTSLRSALGIEP